jgi:hypothetical protein
VFFAPLGGRDRSSYRGRRGGARLPCCAGRFASKASLCASVVDLPDAITMRYRPRSLRTLFTTSQEARGGRDVLGDALGRQGILNTANVGGRPG